MKIKSEAPSESRHIFARKVAEMCTTTRSPFSEAPSEETVAQALAANAILNGWKKEWWLKRKSIVAMVAGGEG
jgi:hypothetical protein